MGKSVFDLIVHLTSDCEFVYRVTLVVRYLGWDDIDLGSSCGRMVAIVAVYPPSRMVEHSKSKSTNKDLMRSGALGSKSFFELS